MMGRAGGGGGKFSLPSPLNEPPDFPSPPSRQRRDSSLPECFRPKTWETPILNVPLQKRKKRSCAAPPPSTSEPTYPQKCPAGAFSRPGCSRSVNMIIILKHHSGVGPGYPPRPLQSPALARDGLPGGGGGHGRQVTVSRGGGGDCKGTMSLSEVFSKIGSSHSQNWSSTSGV